MRIACIATGWYPQQPGGLEKYVYGLVRTLLGAGDTVDLYVNGDAALADDHVRLIPIGRLEDPLWKRMADARIAFARHFRGPYDVINIHFALNALPLIPFINRRTRRVVHFHGPWAAESRAEGGGRAGAAVKAALERFVYRRADRYVVLSTAFKDVLQTYGVDAGRIDVIPMGIDCDFFQPASDRRAVRAGLGWPAQERVFFTARRLIRRVGLLELIEAAAIVRARQSGFRLKIAGKGPLRDELERSIRVHGLDDCVELLGFVSEADLARSYQAADVTILPTQSLEGFGTIITESLACGTPVIVTPIGGMPEVVAPLGAGLIAHSARPEDIAERICAVLDGTLTLPDAESCRRYAVDAFAWQGVAQRVRTIFTTQTRALVQT